MCNTCAHKTPSIVPGFPENRQNMTHFVAQFVHNLCTRFAQMLQILKTHFKKILFFIFFFLFFDFTLKEKWTFLVLFNFHNILKKSDQKCKSQIFKAYTSVVALAFKALIFDPFQNLRTGKSKMSLFLCKFRKSLNFFFNKKCKH